jgi:hypothetical protein
LRCVEGAAALAVLAAAWAPGFRSAPADWRLACLAGVAVVLGAVVSRLPGDAWWAPLGVCAAGLGAGLAPGLAGVAWMVARPAHWMAPPWGGAGDWAGDWAGARWSGYSPPVALLAAAVAVVLWPPLRAAATARLALVPAAAASLCVLPAAGAPYSVVLAGWLAAGAVLLFTRAGRRAVLVVAGAFALAEALAWSLAAAPATVTVCAATAVVVLAVLPTTLPTLRPLPAGVAAGLVCAESAALAGYGGAGATGAGLALGLCAAAEVALVSGLPATAGQDARIRYAVHGVAAAGFVLGAELATPAPRLVTPVLVAGLVASLVAARRVPPAERVGWLVVAAALTCATAPAAALALHASAAGAWLALAVTGLVVTVAGGWMPAAVEVTGAVGYAFAVLGVADDPVARVPVLSVGVAGAAVVAFRPSRRLYAAAATVLAGLVYASQSGGSAAGPGHPPPAWIFVGLAGAAAAVAVAGVWLPRRALPPRELRELVEGVGTVSYAGAALSLADRPGSVAPVLLLGTGAAAVVAVRPARRRHAVAVAVLACLTVAAASYAATGSPTWTLGVVAVTGVLVALAATWLPARVAGWPVAVTAAGVVAFTAGTVPLIFVDLRWHAVVMLLGTAGAVGIALHPARRRVAAIVVAVLAYLTSGVVTVAFTRDVRLMVFAAAAAGALVSLAAIWLEDHHAGVPAPVLEIVGIVGYAVAAPGFAVNPVWLARTLLLGALAAATVAARPGRRSTAYLSGALATGASWSWLVGQEVGTPEAYALPAGALLLIAGYAHRRRRRDLSSWAAYSGGLATMLVPSTIAVFGDRGLVRPTLLGAAALAVLLLGLRRRLQAPLLFGGTVLAVDAVVQLGAYLTAGYDATPRWVLIGAAGLLLLDLGITYERRLRDLRRLRDGFGRMA